MEKHYIRFGEIPQNERSGIFRSDKKIGEEEGVDVFDAINIDGQWRIVLPYSLNSNIGFDLHNLINSKFETSYKVDRKNKMYLVQGDEVGIGSCNEPLLRNVKIIEELFAEQN